MISDRKVYERMHRKGFADVHVHTHKSDAMHIWSPEKVILRARSMGICHMAITDHNRVNRDWLVQSEEHDMDIISSAEMSAEFFIREKQIEPHIVGFRIDPEAEEINRIVQKHKQSRDSYLNAILDGLRADPYDPIDISLEELKEKNKESDHIGRVAIGEEIIARKKAENMREVYSRRLGRESGAPSYVDSKKHLKYEGLEIVVRSTIDAGGLPILAHLPYYGLTEEEEMIFLGIYKDMAGKLACMETEYGDYPASEVQRLKRLANYFGMTESTGSDFHGYEGLDLRLGSFETYMGLQNLWEKYHG